MFLCGVALTIGPQATFRFFVRRKNLKVRRMQLREQPHDALVCHEEGPRTPTVDVAIASAGCVPGHLVPTAA